MEIKFRLSIVQRPIQNYYKSLFFKKGLFDSIEGVIGTLMKVSLTCLRGLEVKQLDVEDLPEL